MPAKRLPKGTFRPRGKDPRRKERKAKRVAPTVFLPDYLDQVKAIAMRGLTDVEMASVFGIEPNMIAKWKRFYPSFKAAIEEGRTQADARVAQALFHRSIGYSHPEEKIHFDGGEHGVGWTRTQTTKHYPPDLPSIKLWMTNRQKEYWKDRHDTNVGGRDDSPALNVGVRAETKLELMSSILALVQPKDDNERKK